MPRWSGEVTRFVGKGMVELVEVTPPHHDYTKPLDWIWILDFLPYTLPSSTQLLYAAAAAAVVVVVVVVVIVSSSTCRWLIGQTPKQAFQPQQ